MTLSNNTIIGIAELVVYVPALVVSIFVCIRHGFSRSSGWLYTLLLCLVRVVGASLQIASQANPDDTNLIIAAAALESIGLTPLVLATLGMLSRLVDWVNRELERPFITIIHFRTIQLFVLIGTILTAVGSSSSSDPNSPPTTSKVSIVLYTLAFIGTVVILIFSTPHRQLVPSAERVIITAVFLACPLIAVRVLYSLLTVFIHSGVFRRYGAPFEVHLCMASIEEFIVVAIYLFIGMRLVKLSKEEQGEILSRPWKDDQGQGSQSGGRRGGAGRLGRRKPRGLIGGLIGLIMSAIASRHERERETHQGHQRNGSGSRQDEHFLVQQQGQYGHRQGVTTEYDPHVSRNV
ncbi:uncharacterized protein C8A04DRAFT_32696 [Dichotomopilus funicola]|uniref:DUF7702 domain-containing protein n=1 Tax=Dichotomopilus funicola TaxID=1934379 RepID=A0AAN6UVE0_9PEZI|nr:hypothetical protein C8A04DRAFT_32696 [Dichotomopilus funicola]